MTLNEKEQRLLTVGYTNKWMSRFNDVLYALIIFKAISVVFKYIFFEATESNLVGGITLIIFGLFCFISVDFINALAGIRIKLIRSDNLPDVSDFYRERSQRERIRSLIWVGVMAIAGAIVWAAGYPWIGGFFIAYSPVIWWFDKRFTQKQRKEAGKIIYMEGLRKTIQSHGARSAQEDGAIPSIEEIKAKGLTNEELFDLGLINEVVLNEKEQFALATAEIYKKIFKKYFLPVYLILSIAFLIGILECIFWLSEVRSLLGILIAGLAGFFALDIYNTLTFYGIIEKLKKGCIVSEGKTLKIKFLILPLLIIFLCLYIFLYFGSGWILSQKVDNEINSIKQKGEFYEIYQIIPPRIPDEENAAKFYTDAIERIPTAGYPIYEELPGDKNYSEYFNKHKGEIRQELESKKEVVNLLIKAYNKPKCRFNLDYEKGLEMKILNFIKIRRIAQDMAIKAYYDLENNEIQKAVDDCVYELRFLKNLNTNNYYLFALACNESLQKIISGPIKIMIERSIKTDYSKLIKELSLLEKEMDGAFFRVLQGGRVMGIEYFKKLSVSNTPLQYILAGTSISSEIKTTIEYGFFKRPFILYDELFYLRYMKKVTEAIKEGQTDEFYPEPPDMNNLFISNALIIDFKAAYSYYNNAMQNLKDLQTKLKALNVPYK
ncbi:MAG: hypothetical protein M1536_01335 [Firmicutes bacterium]|nr:hypothetical protein [Bacillota bacterium]